MVLGTADGERLYAWWLQTKNARQTVLYFHFDNGRKLQNVVAPVLIIHSVDDDYIPFSQAARLFDCAPGSKVMLKTIGSHLDLFDSQEAAVSRLAGFLSR